MSVQVVAGFIVSTLFSTLVSKAVTKWTGNETLGAIAGIATGGWMGAQAAAANAASSTATTSATSSATAGSTMGGAGASTGELAAIGATEGGVAAQGGGTLTGTAADVGVTAETMGAASTGAPIVEQSVQSSTLPQIEGVAAGGGSGIKEGLLSSLTTKDYLDYGGKILSGYQEQSNADRIREYYEAGQRLNEEKFDYDKQKRDEETAYGITRAGESEPIDVGAQLQGVNAASNLSTMNTLTNLTLPGSGVNLLSESGWWEPNKKEVAA